MKIVQKKNGLSLVPETEFEADALAHMFVGNEQRKVVVKSGSSISDIQSVDIVVSNEKLFISGNQKIYKWQEDAKKEVFVYPGSILDILDQLKKSCLCKS